MSFDVTQRHASAPNVWARVDVTPYVVPTATANPVAPELVTGTSTPVSTRVQVALAPPW